MSEATEPPAETPETPMDATEPSQPDVSTQASSETPAAPANTPGGTPIALLDAQPVSPTALPPSLTPSPAPTQIVARPASVSGGADTQPYLIGGILVLAGMAALGWMALMAMLRRQQM